MLRLPKKGSGSPWSRRYWNSEVYPTTSKLLDLHPETRRWLFRVPGPGQGYYWTLQDFPARDTSAVWQREFSGTGPVGSTALFSACGNMIFGKVKDVVDVDRALWLPTDPWRVLEEVHDLAGEGPSLKKVRGPTAGDWSYRARCMGHEAHGTQALGVVVALADMIVRAELAEGGD